MSGIQIGRKEMKGAIHAEGIMPAKPGRRAQECVQVVTGGRAVSEHPGGNGDTAGRYRFTEGLWQQAEFSQLS